MITRIVVCAVIALLVFGAVHLYEMRVKRDNRPNDEPRRGKSGAEPARLS